LGCINFGAGVISSGADAFMGAVFEAPRGTPQTSREPHTILTQPRLCYCQTYPDCGRLFPGNSEVEVSIMKLHPISNHGLIQGEFVRRSVALLALIVAVPTMMAQTAAQQISVQPAGGAVPSQQTAAEVSRQMPAEISAPAPANEDADLTPAPTIPFLSLEAADSGENSSQNGQAAPSNTTATKTRPAHRGLGIALAVVGTLALVSGVALYGGEKQFSLCNGNSGGCNEAKDTGIALMPIGAGVAAVGFYLTFRR
jgi:hypothetical protein